MSLAATRFECALCGRALCGPLVEGDALHDWTQRRDHELVPRGVFVRLLAALSIGPLEYAQPGWYLLHEDDLYSWQLCVDSGSSCGGYYADGEPNVECNCGHRVGYAYAEISMARFVGLDPSRVRQVTPAAGLVI